MLSQRLQDHMAADEHDFKDIKEISNDIKESLSHIETNHLAHIEPDIATLKSDMDWVKKIVTASMVSGIGALMAALFQIIKR